MCIHINNSLPYVCARTWMVLLRIAEQHSLLWHMVRCAADASVQRGGVLGVEGDSAGEHSLR